ncbi:DUF4012 domain-containing protein [Candidatus Peregrinibacteria bacterium]|nr:DUF4012 domain-containing protein [Candidatus Peregrinibacteria bacterium]
MSRPPKKQKLTVQFQPLEGEFFDIRPPKNPSEPILPKVEKGSSSGFGRFFAVAFIIFIAFTVTGIYTSGRYFLAENKNIAFAGYDNLKEGAKSLVNQDFSRAELLFEGAGSAFEEMDRNMRFLTGQANHYLKADLYLDAAQKLLQSGMAVSRIGQELSSLLNDSRAIPSVFIQQNLHNDSSLRLTDLVGAQKERLDRVMAETLLIQKNLTTLNAEALPSDLRQALETAQGYAGLFLTALREVNDNFKTALTLLGDPMPHRYLVLLQNNHELRATGGFIGSYALIDVNDGAISKVEVEDIYQTDGQLSEVIAPPPGIDQVADRLYMRDANYSPDFPTAARQIMWFLEHSRGPTVDTVIAIDQTVAEKLLALTGEVVVPGFPFAIRAENFNDLFSYHIEAKLSKTGTPKQMLIDFIPVFKERLLSLESFSQLNEIALDLIGSRHIQVYSTDPGIQALAQRLHLDGGMIAAQPDVDYLSVITTAIGGNKSDAFINTHLTHHTEVGHMGEVTDHLTIQKAHTWQEEDFAYWAKLISRYGAGELHEKTLRFIQGEGDNVDYMRVYVPKGSRLISLEGVDIEDMESFEDLGYTVFAFTFGPLPAGESQTVKLSYRLPFELNPMDPAKGFDTYRFIVQKQAGAQNITFSKSLQTSDYLQVLETYPPISKTAFILYPQYQTALDGNEIFLSAVTGN